MRRWLLVAVTLFHLWDGRVLAAREWIRHGDEYVLTLADGSAVIVRQPEVRAVTPGPAGGPEPAPAPAGRPR